MVVHDKQAYETMNDLNEMSECCVSCSWLHVIYSRWMVVFLLGCGIPVCINIVVCVSIIDKCRGQENT